MRTPTLVQIFCCLIGIAAGSLSCSTWVNSDWGDCGYSAHYKSDKSGGSTELKFFRITDEVVGGHRNCGFQYIWTKVEKAEIDGSVLPERVEQDAYGENYFYTAPAGFDAKRSVIVITANGSRYRSDPTTVQDINGSVNVKLRPE